MMRPANITFALPDNWHWVRFTECFQQIDRRITVDDLTKYRCIGLRLYGKGAFVREERTGIEIARKQQWIVREGDVVYNKLFAWKGAFAIADSSVDGCIASDKFPSYKLNTELLDPGFVSYYFRTPILARQAQQLSRGSAAVSKFTLNPPQFWELAMPLPSLDVQRHIFTRVRDLENQVDMVHTLRAQAFAETETLMDGYIHEAMGHLSEAGKFGEVIVFKPRSGPSFRTSPQGDGIPVLMPSAVTGFGVNTERVEFGFGDEKVSELDRLIPGDIIIARGNKIMQVGNAGVVPPKAQGWVCANLLMRLQVDKNRVDPAFCIYWLRSPRMRVHVLRMARGTNPRIQKINQKVILEFPYPIGCSLDEQRRVVAYLDDLQAKLDALKKLQTETAAELAALLPSILDKAFKGEL